jgi:hypothetical protein
MKKWLSLLLIFTVLVFFTGGVADAKGSSSFSGGAKSSSSSFSGSSFKSTPSSSSSTSSTSSSGKVSGYKAPAPAGSSYKTSDGGTVTSGGGNVSGYKAPTTSAPTSSQSSTAPSSTNNYYGSRSSGMGGFWTGAAIGSLLTMPSYHTPVVVNGGGYGYGAGYGTGAPSGFNFLGWILWAISWIFVLCLLGGIIYYAYRQWDSRGKR